MSSLDFRTIAEFCASVRARYRKGEISDALTKIVDLVGFVAARERSIARVFSSPELDGLCLEIGAGRRAAPSHFDDGHTVFIATALYQGGGHTRVVKDFIKADPARRKTVLLTGINHRLTAAKVEALFETLDADVDVRLCPYQDLGERLNWTQDQLAECAAGRAYLFQHPYDAVAIAAAQPELFGQLYYFHHADHSLALGVHLPHAVHVDANAKSFHNCRDHGVTGNIVWPLVAEAPALTGTHSFLSRGSLTTCSSGGREKFESPHLIGQLPYKTRYQDVVPLILDATGGTHIHIGKLSDDMLDAIERGLDARKIPRARFVRIRQVPNLAQALIDQNVDVYIGSFPWGGGRAAVEAMAAGIPIAIHSNYRSVFLTDQAEVYPQAMIWREPDELLTHLRALDLPKLQEHGRNARAFFDKNSRPELLAQAIRATLDGETDLPPPRPSYSPDFLQTFFDEETALGTAFDGPRSFRTRARRLIRKAFRKIFGR